MDVANPSYTMSFTRSLAQLKIRGAEQTINEHLIKLIGFKASEELRSSWKRELVRKHFDFMSRIKLKPKNRPVPVSDYLDWLYATPFEGGELGYTESLVRTADDIYERNELDLPELAERMRSFHEALAPRLSRGDDAADLVEAL